MYNIYCFQKHAIKFHYLFYIQFILSSIPKLHTISIAQAVIPTIPVIVLALFLNISLIFHLVLKLIFLNIPVVVIFKDLLFTLGISFLKVSAVFSFKIFLVDKLLLFLLINQCYLVL